MKTRSKAAINFTLLDEFISKKPSKSERRRLQIIEKTITALATSGLDETTHESLADACGISRSLVQHYFPNREELILIAMRFVRARFQQVCVDAMALQDDPRDKMKAYVETACSWAKISPHDAKAWLLFYYHCGIKKKYRTLNTELVDLGHGRIVALLEAGWERSGRASPDDLETRAKLIQNLITGYFLSTVTEDQNPDFSRDLLAATVRLCMSTAGFHYAP